MSTTLAYNLEQTVFPKIQVTNKKQYNCLKMLPVTLYIGDVVVERSPRVRKFAGSIPDRVIPNTLKLVVMSILPWRSGLLG